MPVNAGSWHTIGMSNQHALQQLRQQLQQQLQDEVQAISDIAESAQASADTVTLDQTRMGRLSRMDAMQGQAMAQATNARRSARLVAIQAALTRMQHGNYGDCQECGEQIAWARLQVNAAVSLCIHCAEQSPTA